MWKRCTIFKAHDVPQIALRVAADERRYRQYVTESLALEEQKREARTVLRDRIPRQEHQLSVIERAGTSQVELHRDTSRASVNQLAAAIDQQYDALSDSLRHPQAGYRGSYAPSKCARMLRAIASAKGGGTAFATCKG